MMFSSFSAIIVTLLMCLKNSYAIDESDCGKRYRRGTYNYVGHIDPKNEGRIVGGDPALEGDFPWLVSLQLNGNHYCGGSIVSEEWILTAAHCAKDVHGKVRKNIKARAGTMTIHSGSIHKIVEIVPRKEFTYKSFKRDMSLMRVSPPFIFSSGKNGVGPICLPEPGETFIGSATVAGWGYHYSGSGKVSEKLMALNVNLLSKEECHAYDIFDDDYMLCAGFVEGKKDACQGDSGGPLMVETPEGAITQIGVVSYGEGCADAGKPGVYTDVSGLTEWIEEITGEKPN